MKIHGTFVGINKHDDSSISELTGATRDARALWSLFSDTVPDIDATLLVDERATVAALRHALESSLGQAAPDDIVIFSFSGHGTHDHRLVAYDTDTEELRPTTVGMDELAELFRTCQARAIVCILDCCFSGEAPARVLGSSPIPRDALSSFSLIAGKGRILIAACAENEVAWEQPGTGHGLLTKSLIDVLTGASDETIALTSAFDEIANRTRTEAARIGVTQTPVFINHIEGGLTFPRLKRAAKFFEAFPEFGAPQITGKIEELAAYGIPEDVLRQWGARFGNGLNELQRQAVNEFGVLRGDSALVVAPTSSGKTFIGELAALKAVVRGAKAVFLLPYRALVNEKFQDFSAAYAPIGIRVVRCTGDYSDEASLILSGRYDIAILTYEMFLNLALGSAAMLRQLGLVVLDEGQFVTEPTRGITVELLLTLLIQARERGIDPQLLVLSAVIGDINTFDEWLGCKSLVTTKRPVPLIEGVLDRTGVYEYVDDAGVTRREQLLAPGTVQQRGKKPSSQDVIVPLAKQLVAAGERIIVFRNVRGLTSGCANYLAEELGLPPAAAAIAALPIRDLSQTSGELRKCLAGGTAFHNANLQRGEREVVESFFRRSDGGIAALAATTTLAAGINTPASTVILAETEFIGEENRDFTVAEYKNMVGRAGRLGYNETGKSILLAENAFERQDLFRRYVLGKPEAIRSSFDESGLSTWLIRLLSQVKRARSDQVPQLLLNTYGGYLRERRSPGWSVGVAAQLRALLDRMLTLGLAEQDGEYVQLTLLGRACGRSSLSYDSALRLVELLRERDLRSLRAEDLAAIVQVLEESDGVYTPLMKRGTSESARITDVSSRFGREIAILLQRFAGDDHTYWARCKRSAIVWDWISGEAVGTIEQRFTMNPFQGAIQYGDILRIADNARFHLRSAHQIISVLLVDDRRLLDSLDQLLLRLEAGCPADALPLLELPAPLDRGQILALRSAGLLTPAAVLAAEEDQLTSLLGEVTAKKLTTGRTRPSG